MVYQRLQVTDLKRVVCVLVVYSLANVDFFTVALQLLPVSIDQWQGSDVVLKCSNNQSPLTDVQWTCNTKVAVVYNSSGTCGTFAGFLQYYPHLFSFSCTDGKEFTLTLKKLSRQNNSDECFCEINAGGYVQSNRVTIRVKVPIESTSLNYVGNSLSVLENSVTSIQCYSSDCRPIPAFKWYIDRNTESVADDIILATNEKEIVDDTLIQSFRVVFNIQPNRTLNNWYLFCGGINRNDETIQSRKIFLNISYSPDGPPMIRNYTNGSEIKVIQNMVLQLECVSTGGNPLPNLQWNKESKTPQNTMNNTVTKSLIWTATGITKDELRCYFIYNFTTYMAFIIVEILYPAKIVELYLEYNTGTKVQSSSGIRIIEGEAIALICNATGNPQPTLSWSGKYSENQSRLYIAELIEIHTGAYTCIVENTMVPSAPAGNRNSSRDSASLQLDILYEPVISKMRDEIVAERTDLTKVCTVMNRSAEVIDIGWSIAGKKDFFSSTLKLTNISRTDENVYTCTVNYIMRPTGIEQKSRNKTEKVQIKVAYSPENIIISLRTIAQTYKVTNNDISIIENESLSLNCSAESNPPVSRFEWTGLIYSTGFNLHIQNIKRSQRGELTCHVYNAMNLTEPASIINGYNNSTLQINILYPPRVNTLQEKTIAEGHNLSYDCNFSAGNPSFTTFAWTWKDKTWDKQRLELPNLTRNQSGTYICSVLNTMNASDGHVVHGNASGFFNLIVEYKAKVLRFVAEGHGVSDNVTVNESETVNLVCTIEGRPLATGELSFRGADYLQRNTMELHLQNTSIYDSETLQVVREFNAQCTDSGIHTCTGTNKLYTGLVAAGSLNISLNVNCKPRKSPFHQFPSGDIVGSATFAAVTLNFTTLAYPIPPVSGYVWCRQTNETMSNWTTITSSDTSLVISTSGLQSNLTINNVTRFDFGLYKVMVENKIGSFEYIFNLTAAGIPEVPKDFRHIQESITETSASFQWRPSFNGGLKQFFVLTYKQKDNQNTWKEIAIPDADSDLMTYVATDLSTGTTYDFKLFARNDIGNSSTETITLTTKSRLNQSSSSTSIGAGAGGASASAAFLVIVIALIVTCRKRSREKKNQNSVLNERHVYQNLNKDSDTSHNVYEGLQNKGFDPQYETLSTVASEDKKEQHRVYENLRLACKEIAPQVVEEMEVPKLDSLNIQSVV